jgi:hypothetical protein
MDAVASEGTSGPGERHGARTTHSVHPHTARPAHTHGARAAHSHATRPTHTHAHAAGTAAATAETAMAAATTAAAMPARIREIRQAHHRDQSAGCQSYCDMPQFQLHPPPPAFLKRLRLNI